MRKYILISIILFFNPLILILYGQNNSGLSFLSQYGYVFPTDRFLDGTYTNKPINNFQAYSLRYIIQTKGEKPWHSLYKYPYYGFGIYIADFHSPKHLGSPLALYGFVSKTLFSKGKFSLRNDLSIGVSYFPKHWGVDNLENVSIGSHFNCYVEEGLSLDIELNNNFQTSFGLFLSHFSNGATKKPNWAIYTFQPRISLRYDFNKRGFIENNRLEFEKGFDLVSWIYWGYYSELQERGQFAFTDHMRYVYRYYQAIGLSSVLYRNLSYKRNIGLGINLGYDEKSNSIFNADNGVVISTDSKFIDRLTLNMFLSYEYRIENFSVLFDAGYYLYRIRSETSSSNFFQRIGFRQEVYKDLFLGVSIRASKFRIAHFIEWNVGIRL